MFVIETEGEGSRLPLLHARLVLRHRREGHARPVELDTEQGVYETKRMKGSASGERCHNLGLADGEIERTGKGHLHLYLVAGNFLDLRVLVDEERDLR